MTRVRHAYRSQSKPRDQLVLDLVLEDCGGSDDPRPFEDAAALMYRFVADHPVEGTAYARRVRELGEEAVVRLTAPGAGLAGRVAAAGRVLAVVERMLFAAAPFDFDSYMLYMEWTREPSKQFYRPRREVLLPLVADLQDLYDSRIDFLAVSMPPRTGKSTLCIFFLTFVMGNHPTRANVMSGHSDKLTKGFHQEALSIITDGDTYRYAAVFPDSPLADKSMADETISLVVKRRFPTLTCRSIDGTLTGAVEVGRHALLYCDDLVSDREEALSSDRMDKLYQAYLNQLRDRMNDGAKQLFVATRWVPNDPIGRISEQYEGNPRYRFTVMPALDGVPWEEEVPLSFAATCHATVVSRDPEAGTAVIRHEHGRSNFEYGGGIGFSTEYYEDMRESLIEAGEGDSWDAKYQGAPRYIGGLMFASDNLRYYDGTLPEREPDAVIAACDTKDKGRDYASMPVAYVYGEDYYVHRVVCDNSLPEFVEPKLAKALCEEGVSVARFESNAAGGRVADDVKAECREMGHVVEVRKVYSTDNKETRILVDSLWVKERCLFRADEPDEDYRRFMAMLTHYTTEGKNAHDDPPDSMSMLKRLACSIRPTVAKAVRRVC